MKLSVLGCHGGELPNCRTTCFLVDEVLALDAGALCASLPLEQLCRVDHVVLTHSHFDHVKDLPLLADLVVGRRTTPVTIWGSEACARTLRQSVFNDELWPDFTRLPDPMHPVFQLRSFRAGSTFQAGPFEITSIPVCHPVESCGFVVRRGGRALGMSGDTGPTEKLWEVLNATKNLKALLLETSFPNHMQALADLSGHLTPQTLAIELKKLRQDGSPVLLYHLKPAFLAELKAEVAGLPVRVLELGDTFDL